MKDKIEQAIIIAGGMGTRLKPFTNTMPKAMYPVDNVPFIERLILQIKDFGINNVLVLLGYLPDKIIDYLGDGSKYGINIEYDISPVEYDTADRMIHAKDKIKNEFLFMYCDNYCPIDFNKLVNNYYNDNALIELSVYSNREDYTKSNIKIDDNSNMVLVYDKNRTQSDLSGVEIGYSIVNKKIFDMLTDDEKNFNKNIFPKLIKEGKLFATITEHRYYSIGSFDRMHLTEEFFKPKKVVFIDRDGTINVKAKKAHYIENVDAFKWLDGAREAIKLLNDNNVIVILVTNQPGIARGVFSIETLNDIHRKMQDDLKKIGARIDYIYCCTHNWDEGCFCRKPSPGMLYQAGKDLSLDLTKCILFGDDERDIEAANNANCKSELITSEYTLLDAVKKYLGK